jgi:hypothetical protein
VVSRGLAWEWPQRGSFWESGRTSETWDLISAWAREKEVSIAEWRVIVMRQNEGAKHRRYSPNRRKRDSVWDSARERGGGTFESIEGSAIPEAQPRSPVRRSGFLRPRALRSGRDGCPHHSPYSGFPTVRKSPIPLRPCLLFRTATLPPFDSSRRYFLRSVFCPSIGPRLVE